MVQLAILNGVYSKALADWRISHPRNMEPFGIQTGISNGYLRTAAGVVPAGSGPGIDRGGTNWNERHYRVMGSSLVEVGAGGGVNAIGSVGNTGERASFAASFDRLGIACDKSLYYLRGGTLTKVTDPDLGLVLDVVWIDGYFMTTDGTSLVVTELNDPASIDPLKYGSSESDPDPITGLLTLRGEVYALNRYSIEVFGNTGSTGFPFQRQRGAQIDRGCVSASAKCLYGDTFAFCGGSRDEPPGVFVAGSGSADRVSPHELEESLSVLSADELATVVLESRNTAGDRQLYVHLPAETWIYHETASAKLGIPAWTVRGCGANGTDVYRARGWVYAHRNWWCGDTDTPAIGLFTDATANVFGEPQTYSFDTALIYNSGVGAIIHELELVGQYGRAAVGQKPTLRMSYSEDALTYSQERPAGLGWTGERNTRVVWRRLGRMRNLRSFRFTGRGSQMVAFARLEAQIEALSNGR